MELDFLSVMVGGGGATLIISLVLLLSREFFAGYLAEKGKNLATQEDVENLTRIVKNVEKEFDESTRWLQSKVDRLTSRQSRLDEQRVAAWMNLVDEIVLVLESKISPSPINTDLVGMGREEFEAFAAEVTREAHGGVSRALLAYNRVVALSPREGPVYEAAKEAVKQIITLRHNWTRSMRRLRKANEGQSPGEVAAAHQAHHSEVVGPMREVRRSIKSLTSAIGAELQRQDAEELARVGPPAAQVSGLPATVPGTPDPDADKGGEEPVPAKR